MVNVDDVADPEWNDHPYDNLVLKEEQKTLLMAFADNQVRNTGFDDFVKHKGKSSRRNEVSTANCNVIGEGTIILLAGPPGVGKTLTSEAGEWPNPQYVLSGDGKADSETVAEKSRVPLYMLSAGELGSRPEDLEAGLKRALTCCQLWHAVLLIDEADVFMESRSSNNLIRNELVSSKSHTHPAHSKYTHTMIQSSLESSSTTKVCYS